MSARSIAGHRGGVVRRERRLRPVQYLGQGGGVGGEHRRAARERLGRRQPEPLARARHHEHLARPVRGAELVVTDRPQELEPLGARLVPGAGQDRLHVALAERARHGEPPAAAHPRREQRPGGQQAGEVLAVVLAADGEHERATTIAATTRGGRGEVCGHAGPDRPHTRRVDAQQLDHLAAGVAGDGQQEVHRAAGARTGRGSGGPSTGSRGTAPAPGAG